MFAFERVPTCRAGGAEESRDIAVLDEHLRRQVALHPPQNRCMRHDDAALRHHDRYILPKSTPLDPVPVRDEVTEFAFAQPGASLLEGLPVITEQPGVGWIEITGAAVPGYPRLPLVPSNNSILTTHLERSAITRELSSE